MRTNRQWTVDGVDWTDRVPEVLAHLPKAAVEKICAVCKNRNIHNVRPLGAKDGLNGELMTGMVCGHQWIEVSRTDEHN